MRIALDALGGDAAPEVIISGALLALKESSSRNLSDLHILLFGPRARLEPFFKSRLPENLEIYDVPESEPNPDDPHIAGADPNSIIRTALRKHREGECDAVISAGSTGAQVLASLLELDKCSGITRPAIGVAIPTVSGRCFLIDVGASLVASPHHLIQFAAMGIVYVGEVLGKKQPKVGLLNVGGEEQIGERNIIETHRLLIESGIPFVGNIEGGDILKGKADVVVTNGFTGNILLKFLEGMPEFITGFLGLKVEEEMVMRLSKYLDYQKLGGEPLLGVRGVSMICHGASSEQAIASAIFRAIEISKHNLPEKIEAYIKDKFSSYFSRIKYLRSFRSGLRR